MSLCIDSPAIIHRYTLYRNWLTGNGKVVNFLMLNPSTATDIGDETTRAMAVAANPLSTDKERETARAFLDSRPIREDLDDPTIRKCCGYAKRWGYSGIVVTNIFSMRATKPADMKKAAAADYRAVAGGAENDAAIAKEADAAGLVLVAWGTHGGFMGRAEEVMSGILSGFDLYCIGLTGEGFPKHPCMAAYTEAPVLFRGRVG